MAGPDHDKDAILIQSSTNQLTDPELKVIKSIGEWNYFSKVYIASRN